MNSECPKQGNYFLSSDDKRRFCSGHKKEKMTFMGREENFTVKNVQNHLMKFEP